MTAVFRKHLLQISFINLFLCRSRRSISYVCVTVIYVQGKTIFKCFYYSAFNTFYLWLQGRKEGRKEGNVLFNDKLNTFYLRLYGITHMVKDHSDREETHSCHIGYSFRLAARVLYIHHPTDRIIHITAFVTPVVEHWLEQEIAQWVGRQRESEREREREREERERERERERDREREKEKKREKERKREREREEEKKGE